MDLRRTCIPDHLDDLLTRCAAHDGVIDHHDTLSLERVFDRVQLDFYTKMPDALLGLDERSSHVVVPDKPGIKGQSRLFSVSKGRRNSRVRHRDHDIGRYVGLTGKLPAEILTYRIHVLTEDHAVWPYKINELKNAMRRLRGSERKRRLDPF